MESYLEFRIQAFSLYPNSSKIADFGWKNGQISWTQSAIYVIYMFFGFALANV